MWSRFLTLATPTDGLHHRLRIACLIVWAFAWIACAQGASADQALRIWFDAPANDWEREGLPIGNGAMGAVIQGGLELDTLQFNEKTLWTGGPGSTQGYDFGLPRESRRAAGPLARRGATCLKRQQPDRQEKGPRAAGRIVFISFCRGAGTRTRDLCVPNAAR